MNAPHGILKHLLVFLAFFPLMAVSLCAMQAYLPDDPGGGGGGGYSGGDGGGATTTGTTTSSTSHPYAIHGYALGGYTNAINVYCCRMGGTAVGPTGLSYGNAGVWGVVNLDELSYNCITNASANSGAAVVGQAVYGQGGYQYVYGGGAYGVMTPNGLVVHMANGQSGYLDLRQLTQNVATALSSSNTNAVAGRSTAGAQVQDYSYGYPACPRYRGDWLCTPSGNLVFGFINSNSQKETGGPDPGQNDWSYAWVNWNELSWNKAAMGQPPTGSLTVNTQGGGAGGVSLSWSVKASETN